MFFSARAKGLFHTNLVVYKCGRANPALRMEPRMTIHNPVPLRVSGLVAFLHMGLPGDVMTNAFGAERMCCRP